MNRLLLLFFLTISCLSIAQHQDKVDFRHVRAKIYPSFGQKSLKGNINYTFEVFGRVDSVFLDAKNMEFYEILLNGKKVKYNYDGRILTVFKNFRPKMEHKIYLHYLARPNQAVYYLENKTLELSPINGKPKLLPQIWTQGQGKYTSHWLPSFDDMEEKVEFDISINSSAKLDVIANGKLLEKEFGGHGTLDWRFDMQKPMSSYLLAFVIGNYEKQGLKSTNGIPIENYYYPQDSLKVEPTYRHTKEIFDFLEREIGVPYPWQNYKQVPVHDFLYAGMENTTLTIFSDQYMIDSTAFVDKNYVNVNAHEMAHQWFGNLVTEKNGNHHWLHEGFATYYAYLAEQHLFGDDHFYWRFHETLEQLQSVADKGEGQSLLDPKASSLTFYEKGAWALLVLRYEIGDAAFKKGIKSYLEKYQFKNVTVQDFLSEMELASGKNLSGYRREWLENKGLPFKEADEFLVKQCPSIKLLLDMETELKASRSDDIDYTKLWDTTNSIHLKKYLLKNFTTSLPKEIFARAFETDTIPVRQALFSGRNLPTFLDQEKLESLLVDDSYVTKESALFSLWQSYPDDRSKYLNMTKDIIGLPNKNIRLMWLTLAILTENFESLETKKYFDELSGYTGQEYSFEVRQGAFFYLKEAFGFNDKSLVNLIHATNHHAWQFKKFARNMLDELLKDPDYKSRLQAIAKELNQKEIRYLNSKLVEE